MQPEPFLDRTLPAGPGDRVSHFEIESVLGKGGMGVVFAARDLRLGCPVALKCPWPVLARDPVSRNRFLREGKTASRLVHPNIVPVREVFEENGLPWLVMSLIRGRSLRDLLAEQGRIPLERILQIADDLTAALEAAHAQGILHRDVTPGNIIFDAEGRALLTDFGLAVFTSAADRGSDGSTVATAGTEAGTVLGTPAYRSPEQTLGRKLDARSDIFSLGAVLYEMCTGRPAFTPSLEGDVVDAILHRQPEPVSRLNYEIPEDLERIVRKAMAKQPEERYQTVRDMRADLRAVQHRVQFARYAETHPAGPPRSRLRVIHPSLAVGVLLTAVVLIATWYWFLRPEPEIVGLHGSIRISRDGGWDDQPVLSPDGTMVAYCSRKNGNADIYVAAVSGGDALRVTRDPAADTDPAWFPDGATLVFTSNRGGEPSLWKVGAMGGAPTLLVRGAKQPAVSPDGTRIAFSRMMSGGYERIGVVSLSNLGAIRMLTSDRDGLWEHLDPCWSRDGTRICYSAFNGIWLVPAEGGKAKQITSGEASEGQACWSFNGKYIYFTRTVGSMKSLWRRDVRKGREQRVTLGIGPESHPSISRDGSRLAFTTSVSRKRLVLVDRRDGTRSELAGVCGVEMPTMSPDGKEVVFMCSRSAGKYDLWAQAVDGTRFTGPVRRLMDQPGTASHPMYSPDGKWIAYYRILGQERDIWVVPAQGGGPIQFTEGPTNDIHPAWSPDGTQLAYVANFGDSSEIRVAGIRDGRRTSPFRVVPTPGVRPYAPHWSPDGTLLAFQGVQGGTTDIWVVPVDGGSPPRRLTTGAEAWRVRWDVGGKWLLVSGQWGKDTPEIRRVPLQGGPARKLAVSVSESGEVPSIGFDVSPDGKILALVGQANEGDVWVLEADPGVF